MPERATPKHRTLGGHCGNPSCPRMFAVRAGGAVGLGSGQPRAPAGRPPVVPQTPYTFTELQGVVTDSAAVHRLSLGQTRDARIGNRTARAMLVMELPGHLAAWWAAWPDGLMVLAFLGSHGEDAENAGAPWAQPQLRAQRNQRSQVEVRAPKGHANLGCSLRARDGRALVVGASRGGSAVSSQCHRPCLRGGVLRPLGRWEGPSALTVSLEVLGAPRFPRQPPAFLL